MSDKNNTVIEDYTYFIGKPIYLPKIYDIVGNQLVLKQMFHMLDETNVPTFIKKVCVIDPGTVNQREKNG